MKRSKIARMFRVEPGTKFRVRDHRTDISRFKDLQKATGSEIKRRAKAHLEENLEDLTRVQELLYANSTWSVLIVFQAMDAGGKDSMIKHVMSGLNPQGCQVFSFKRPSVEELSHNFLWRYSKCLPERGHLGIFNRSYYEEVLVVRVHPDLLSRQRLPRAQQTKDVWRDRFEDINSFERHLARNGTLVLKFFLNVSKKEQKKRFLERLTEREKHWKFEAADLNERAFWNDYMKAFDAAITATSTPWAPWYVIPADQKWVARALVSAIISHAIDSLDLELPQVNKQQIKELRAARRQLLAE